MGTLFSILDERKKPGFLEKLSRDWREMDETMKKIVQLEDYLAKLKSNGSSESGLDYRDSMRNLKSLRVKYSLYPLPLRIVKAIQY